MAIRTILGQPLICGLIFLCLSGIILGAEQEVEDFEFAENDNEIKIVKRAAVTSDDEDFLSDEPGSGKEGTDYEGSGTLEPDTGKGPDVVTNPGVDNYPHFYRVELTMPRLRYSRGLEDRESQEFKRMAASLQRDIEALYQNVPGQQQVTVLAFSWDGTVLVTFDLGTQGYNDEAALKTVLDNAVRRGYIASNPVTSDSFSFSPLDDGIQCPSTVGREPDALPRTGSNWANLLINNAFPCAGSVIGWEYYRLVPRGTAYVGVWRQRTDSEFILIRKTPLPSAPIGVRTVEVPSPISVQRGDFIGIFYPRNVPNNVIAQATLEDDAVAASELYQNYHAEFYNDDVDEGVPFNIDSVPFSSINTTFSIRALVDYQSGGPDISTIYTCSPNEYACGDGYCIAAEYKCDGQIDCPSGVDEEGCPRCSDDDFTCRSGQCLPVFLQCNGEADCVDGSDEENCPPECGPNEFQCRDSSCIPADARCDSRADCPEGEDEFGCVASTIPPACPLGLFRCDSGICIDGSKKCDGSLDCFDGSDELNCKSRPCVDGEFTCDNGNCIDARLECDGVPDCLDLSDEANCGRTCSPREFTCDDGQCVDIRSRCNTIYECADRSDERGCPCRSGEFECGDGRCIPGNRACDGTPDCADRSDEADCARCRRNEFECSDGSCIDRRYKCDRVVQCADGSDEFNCTCNSAEFRCNNGQCVSSLAYCNGQQDCLDRSDELDCGPRCPEDHKTCDSGECLDPRRVCDGRQDCRDGSDERDCPVRRRCPVEQFQCDSGHCLPMPRRCDGRRDCPNGSDEEDCPTCSPNEFTCVSDGQCISQNRRCDRRIDCRDRSDEENCPCREGEFTCVSDNRCLPPGYRCNGNPDCQDGSDEEDCVKECDAREFRCDNDQCIIRQARCDGRFDCSDGSDERNCPTPVTLSVTPQQLRVRIGREAVFICQATGNPAPRVSWSRRTGGAMPIQATEANGRLTITNVRPEDAGDYLCRATTSSQTYETVARLAVDYIGPPTEEPGPDGPCQRDEATCPNGQCIPRDYLCDGERDCVDGSDENNCNVVLPCEPNEFRCNNGRCAMKIWRCDGDDDCLDGSDENNCPSRIPGAPCQADEFMCRTGSQCVPLSYHCDGENDCQDRSDEIGCTQPSIITPPVKEITVEINGTFTIICEAVGIPTPLIVWRLNWGNIPTGPRVTVTSVNGRGVLEVRNAIPEDAGAYTCEAINNRGSIFAIPDALIIVRRTVGVCQVPEFNSDALRQEECVRCFCFGHTQTCYSSGLQLSQITLGNRVELVRRPTLEPTEQGFIQYIPSSREFEVRDFNRVLRTGSYYWSLPYQYLSKRLSSYGGELTYNVYYEVDEFDSPTTDPDVIISGNGMTLIHRSEQGFKPRMPTSVRVPLREDAWERSRDSRFGGSAISDYASREDMMLVLENVTSVLIRATYDNRQSMIRLGNVLLTTGVTQNTGLGRAVYVEECTCPAGYAGFSCEECAPGFYRVERGRYGRECIACNCNGHSNECDPETGICRNCRDNTVGPYCNECAEGYIGDARGRRQDACQPCPCPLTNPENQFSRTCAYDANRQIICTNCAEGYEGSQCERCAEGYEGNPRVPGQGCTRVDIETLCDNRGSLRSRPWFGGQECECKVNVEGPLCDTCRAGTFHLSSRFPSGCISCFCMGVTQTCQSTAWNRAQVTLEFNQSPGGMALTDVLQKERITDNLIINRQDRELVFRGFRSLDRGIHYWTLPEQFLGDKVSSYGGDLRFTLRYRPGPDNTPISLKDPMVEISGNDISLVYRASGQVAENRKQSFQVPFIESEWLRIDGERATREHLLMALADLDVILVRATYTTDTEEASISSISMDIAEDRITGLDRAYPVEQCSCPRGYKGLSCEDCDTGYTRTGGGLYLGLCEPCQCNGHSSNCDPETGVCRNCRHNTEGDNCERCSRGFYGDATRGSVNDCQSCPCPLTESPNQFSTDCKLDTDGQVTCISCPAGYTGRRCERCAEGYQGNPQQPGDYCKVINVTCDCDGRGIVPNTLCDPNTQQCQCKTYVQGRRCSTCQEGYFHLSRDNQQGCLQCFCMGISSQCSSSNYYRDLILPMLSSDGSHNFMLTNRRLSRMISDGFTMNADQNEISFDNFEGIQRERESLFFQLPPKFRGDKVTSYGGYLRFGLSYTTAFNTGQDYMDVDVEIISKQDKRMYYLFRPSPKARQSYEYEILLHEDSFRNLMDGQRPSREMFMTVLADIDAILIRATYHTVMTSVTLRDLNMEIAVPRANGLRPAPEVESCICPEGYTGLSCQECAAGYLRVQDSGTALGRCTRCNCNGHASSCDPQTGVCQDCQHNTEGERCERCIRGYYGNPTSGTPNDCRVCPCPLTIPSNQFSPTCFLDQDDRVTCDRCPTGYTGRDCGTCAPGYSGNPREPGSRCERITDEPSPIVTVNPTELAEPLGSTATFQCTARGRGPFNVVWSRLDGRPLPPRAVVGPGPSHLLTITELEYADAARYVCTVTNAFGSNRDYATLSVPPPDTMIRVKIEDPTTVVTQPGQTVRFICVAIEYSSAANYVLSWMKDGGSLPSKVIDQNGVLVIPNVDENDIGTYTCTGSDPAGQDRATAVIRFGTIVAPPSVRIEPRYVEVSEGDSAQFRCVAEGSPQPTVRWTKGPDGPLPNYVITDESGLFRISDVSMADQSEYYCTATNSEGTASVRTIIYVRRQRDRVEIIVRRADIIATVGGTEQLVCYAQGNSDVNLVWSRDVQGLPAGSSQQNGVLTLENIQPSYAGNYVCTGTTPTGVVGRATVRVTVEGRRSTAPTVRIEPERLVVGSGTTGTLRCVADGEPEPTITWSRARGELSSNHQVSNGVLRILQASMDDRDLYLCVAENRAGRAQASAMVDIERREAPLVELYPDIQQTLSTGANALFQCRVIGGIPAPTVTWSRAGDRPFTSRVEVKDNGVLMFTDLTTEEQGEYMCSATNEVGTITTTASLRVEGPPVIDITPGKEIVSIVGDRVNIECIGLGEPTPSVFWRSETRRRSDVLPEAFASGPGQATLLFDAVSRGDAGRYICIATNDRGRREETVDLTVVDRGGPTRPVVAIEGPEQISVVSGQSVELTCSSQGINNPRIRWRRPGGVPLPPNHSVRNGVLYIPRVEPEYEGEYICTVTSEVPGPEFTASIFIFVTVTPAIRVDPRSVTHRPGETLTLRCQPTGSGPFNIEWTKVNGQLSPNAREANGILEIRQVTSADAGRYRCRVTNAGGSSDGYADVRILAPPSVDVQPRQQNLVAGGTIDIRCLAQGDPPLTIRWTKDDGELPLQHQIRNGVLTLYNVQPEDSGRYICSASNDAGTTQDYAYIRVEGQGSGIITGPGVQNAKVGERIEFECVVTGTTTPTVTWTKLEGPLPQSAIISNNILIINSVTPEDSGTYRCTATNAAGSVQSQVRLFVMGRPTISVQEDYTTAALGTPAQLRCDATGSPAPQIQWMKEDGDLPEDHSITDNGILYIPRVREEDAGTYRCMASNNLGVSRSPVVLAVKALVPYFEQNPTSYMAFAPLNDVYLDLDILMSFRPEATDGLLLYNGQYPTGSGDYVCFGLREAYPEFRFDVGAGPAIIRGAQPLELNRWHTVHFKRNRKNGTLVVNDEPMYSGQAPGQFQGLDIAEPMYVGSVPDFQALPRSAAFNQGFVGGIGQIEVKGVNLNLGAEATNIVGVQSYQVCRDRPCMNGGACQPKNSVYGFECVCPEGFTGDRCEMIGERCYPGACGAKGRCFNLPGNSGFRCICPMGFSGEGCAQGLTIIDPAFNKTSFISYPKIHDALLSSRLRLMFKPKSLDDGIILYNAQKQDGKQDFIAIIIKNSFLEFRFDTGSGPAILRSRNPLRLNEWTMVVAGRTGREGMLIVNSDEAVNEETQPNDGDLFSRRDRGDIRGSTSGERTIGLNIERPLFLGGVDPYEMISVNAGASEGFVGCIAELEVNGREIELIEDALESVNVQDCGDRSLCARKPCRNGASCLDISPTQYQCVCTEQFTGENCQIEINVCVTNNPCLNGGVCVVGQAGSYRCDCPLGWMGRDCETELEITTHIEVVGDGYVEFKKEMFPHRRRQTKEVISLALTTTSSNGLVFWQGQRPGQQGGRDFLALAIQDGYLEFRYELGSGKAVIRSEMPIDDGFRHVIVAERLGRDGSLTVDDRPPVTGTSKGNLQVLNVAGNIFFGGVPDMERYTASQFENNFDGCILDVRIQNNDPVHFGNEAEGGMNIRPCPQ